MHPRQTRNWVAIGRAVVYYDQVSQSFNARTECLHCMRLLVRVGNVEEVLSSHFCHVVSFHLSSRSGTIRQFPLQVSASSALM